ncbi:MAG: hypothetical protein ACLGHE_10600 [Gammaproteobacteria bacterium]
MKTHFLKTRVSTEIFAELCRETDLRGCTLSDLVREKIRMADQTMALSKALARLEAKVEYLVMAIEQMTLLDGQFVKDGDDDEE